MNNNLCHKGEELLKIEKMKEGPSKLQQLVTNTGSGEEENTDLIIFVVQHFTTSCRYNFLLFCTCHYMKIDCVISNTIGIDLFINIKTLMVPFAIT